MRKLIAGALLAAFAAALTGCQKSGEAVLTPSGNESVIINDNTGAVAGADLESEGGMEAANQTNEEAYMSFLKGEITAISDIDKEGIFRRGNKYSYKEVVKSFMDDEDTISNSLSGAYYAYIDCGSDGNREMAVKLEYGDYDAVSEFLILKNKEDGVHICANAYGYYRTYASINRYGVITTGGSGGAAIYCQDFAFVDGDGEYHFLYTDNSEMDMSIPIVPYYELPQDTMLKDYPEDYYNYESGDTLYTCDSYSFTEYEYNGNESYIDEYARTKFYVLTDDRDNDVVPSSEHQELLDNMGVKLYTKSEAKELIKERLDEFNITEEMLTEEELDWISLAKAGIGEYSQKPATENDTINMLSGKWIYQNSWSPELDKLYLEIKLNADFAININYIDSYAAPGYIKGHIVLDYNDGWAPTRDRFAFYVESSNVESVKEGTYMEYYLIDSYTMADGKVTMVLDDVSYVESFINVTFSDTMPKFEKEWKDEENQGTYLYLTEPEDGYYDGGDYDYTNAVTPKLTLSSEVENEITDEERWFAQVGIRGNEKKYSDGTYTYEFSGEEGYGDLTMLTVYDSEGNRLYTFDFHDFKYADGYEYQDFVSRSIRYALIKDNLLFVNYYHRTYASSCPLNAYIAAIDLENGWFKWKSEPLVSNSGNFVIAGDYIITGYGFSAEDHYLSLINCDTGSEEQRIAIKKSPDFFALKDDKLYVRTYSYDLEYDVAYE